VVVAAVDVVVSALLPFSDLVAMIVEYYWWLVGVGGGDRRGGKGYCHRLDQSKRGGSCSSCTNWVARKKGICVQ
jgi:hypothetical protein